MHDLAAVDTNTNTITITMLYDSGAGWNSTSIFIPLPNGPTLIRRAEKDL